MFKTPTSSNHKPSVNPSTPTPNHLNIFINRIKCIIYNIYNLTLLLQTILIITHCTQNPHKLGTYTHAHTTLLWPFTNPQITPDHDWLLGIRNLNNYWVTAVQLGLCHGLGPGAVYLHFHALLLQSCCRLHNHGTSQELYVAHAQGRGKSAIDTSLTTRRSTFF